MDLLSQKMLYTVAAFHKGIKAFEMVTLRRFYYFLSFAKFDLIGTDLLNSNFPS